MKLSKQFILKRDQIWVLIAKDFKLKYNSTALGFVWSLLMPTFTSVVYYCTRVIKIDHGRIIADGPTAEVLG